MKPKKTKYQTLDLQPLETVIYSENSNHRRQQTCTQTENTVIQPSPILTPGNDMQDQITPSQTIGHIYPRNGNHHRENPSPHKSKVGNHHHKN